MARYTFFTSHRTRALRGRTHVRGVRAAAPGCGTPSHASRLALRAQNEVVAQLLRDEPARSAARALAGGVGGKCAGRAEERAGVAPVVPDDDPVPVEGRRRPHPHARGGGDDACPAPDFRLADGHVPHRAIWLRSSRCAPNTPGSAQEPQERACGGLNISPGRQKSLARSMFAAKVLLRARSILGTKLARCFLGM